MVPPPPLGTDRMDDVSSLLVVPVSTKRCGLKSQTRLAQMLLTSPVIIWLNPCRHCSTRLLPLTAIRVLHQMLRIEGMMFSSGHLDGGAGTCVLQNLSLCFLAMHPRSSSMPLLLEVLQRLHDRMKMSHLLLYAKNLSHILHPDRQKMKTHPRLSVQRTHTVVGLIGFFLSTNFLYISTNQLPGCSWIQ